MPGSPEGPRIPPTQSVERKSLVIEGRFEEELFSHLVRKYADSVKEIQKLEKKKRGIPDPAIDAEIATIDAERHQTHLNLIRCGEDIGKSKDDVLVAILAQEKNLAEYGLPEFSLMTDMDLYGFHQSTNREFTKEEIQAYIDQRYGKDWDGLDAYDRLTIKKELEEIESYSEESLRNALKISHERQVNERREHNRRERWREAWRALSRIKEDESFIPFYTMHWSYDEGGGWDDKSPDEDPLREQKIERMEKFLQTAKPFHARESVFQDSEFFHSKSITMGGIILKNKELEQVLAYIREHPEFRIAPEFLEQENNKTPD